MARSTRVVMLSQTSDLKYNTLQGYKDIIHSRIRNSSVVITYILYVVVITFSDILNVANTILYDYNN